MVECSFMNYLLVGSSPFVATYTSDFDLASSKEFLDIQIFIESEFTLKCVCDILDVLATIECEFTLKRLCDMIRTYSQMHHIDKCSQHSSII